MFPVVLVIVGGVVTYVYGKAIGTAIAKLFK